MLCKVLRYEGKLERCYPRSYIPMSMGRGENGSAWQNSREICSMTAWGFLNIACVLPLWQDSMVCQHQNQQDRVYSCAQEKADLLFTLLSLEVPRALEAPSSLPGCTKVWVTAQSHSGIFLHFLLVKQLNYYWATGNTV